MSRPLLSGVKPVERERDTLTDRKRKRKVKTSRGREMDGYGWRGYNDQHLCTIYLAADQRDMPHPTPSAITACNFQQCRHPHLHHWNIPPPPHSTTPPPPHTPPHFFCACRISLSELSTRGGLLSDKPASSP